MGINVKDYNENFQFEITGVSYIGKPKAHTAMFVSKKVEYLIESLFNLKECLIFVENGVVVPEELQKSHCFVFSDNPSRDYAFLANRLFEERSQEDLRIKYKSVQGSMISENAKIGKNVVIEPGCLIGHRVLIGNNVTIKSGAVIKEAKIGDGVVINENAVVGGQGFTMSKDEKGNRLRIPSLGMVMIGDNAEIGSLNNISAGCGGNTTIGNNVKLDSLVHIGHDAYLHDNVEISAGAVIGGYVEINEQSFIGINSVIRNRICLGEGCFVGMGAVVTKTIEPGVTVVGNPAKPFEKNQT